MTANIQTFIAHDQRRVIGKHKQADLSKYSSLHIITFKVSGAKIFRLFISVNGIHNVVIGSEIYVGELTLCFFVSDNTEIYFNIPEARLKFFNISYQSDYPMAHTLSIDFKNCLSQSR